MSAMKSLQVFNVSGNGLQEIPSEIGDYPALEKLFLNENELAEIPSEIGRLTNLVELNLDENRLTLVPTELAKMQSLEILNINQNTLTDLPNEIYLLPLKMFGIDDNPFDGIPEEVVEGGSQEVFDFLGQRLKEAQAQQGK